MPATITNLFDAPPVTEVGFGIVTSSQMIDPYDIRAAHDVFRADYPGLERQAPVSRLQSPVSFLSAPAVEDDDLGVPPRWWFVSNEGDEIVQAQERFIGWNWRRGVPADVRVDYPGFEVVHARARQAFDRLIEWRGSSHGSLPAPSTVQLMYDNMIPLEDADGKAIPLQSILKNWNTVHARIPIVGWELRWAEPLADESDSIESGDIPDDGSGLLAVNCSIVGVIMGERDPLPVMRLMLTAQKPASDWDTAFSFFPAAHDHIRKTFLRLLTDEVVASWGTQ